MRRLLSVLFLIVPTAASAQGDCFPAKGSHEARLFGHFAVPLAFGPAAAPMRPAPWSIAVGLEASYLPKASDEIATPTVCRPGKGPENTDFGPVLPRPRLSVGLPGGFLFEAGWVPPITRIKGAKANIVSVALGRTFQFGSGGMVLGLRAHATAGVIHAPIVCNEEALQDPVSECFNGTKSDERYKPNTFGLEAALGWALGGGRVRPFLGGGYNLLHPRFQVHFKNQFGQLDQRKVEVDLNRAVLFAGASWFPSPLFSLTGEIYSAPTDLVTGRVVVSYMLHRSGR